MALKRSMVINSLKTIEFECKILAELNEFIRTKQLCIRMALKRYMGQTKTFAENGEREGVFYEIKRSTPLKMNGCDG